MRLPSVMGHTFGANPAVGIQRSSFDRSHGHKTTFDSGYLVPIYVDEALPGDTFSLKATMFARLTTQIVPVMDNMYLETFFFAVPVRLLWANFKKFMGEQASPGDSTDYLVPTIVSPVGGFTAHSVFDYMGIPTGIANLSVNALHLRAYKLIWQEWFRDENLQATTPVSTNDGPDLYSYYPLYRRNKRPDYFTSCLPWPQKGNAVQLPLGTTAPVFYSGTGAGGSISAKDGSGTLRSFLADGYVHLGSSTDAGNSSYALTTDLSAATAATVNQLRQAFQVQRLLERNARCGTRYTEIIQAHFSVVSPDSRLQRPEYLGGSSTRININSVAQTSATDANGALGDLAAFGVATDHFHGFTKSFTEHMVIIGLANVRADLTYQQGLDRMWSRQTKYDYYWPSLANLGEQAVLNKEIYAQGNSADNDVFGYQERWAEYRHKPSRITGKLRSTYAQPLDFWHLSQKFTALPTLGDTFIQDNPPISRIVAVTTEPQFFLDCFFDLKCARPMPMFSVPGLIDHF